jgi:hypothetical protein
MNLHKIGVKFFAQEKEPIDLVELIPIFHRWIQTKALDDLLIDVADYSHVHAGPGTLLVAHEGNYGFDETNERRGISYYSKRQLKGDLPERLGTVCRKALKACQLLEQSEETKGRVKFRGNELQVFSNDRLIAPNTDETFTALEPALGNFLVRLYPETAYDIEREMDPKERFSVTVKTSEALSIDTVLTRLAVQGHVPVA